MTKTFEELEQDVIAWAENLGIFEKSDPVSQMLKTASEVGELCDAINKGRIEEARLELGDVLVTLILQCRMQGFLAFDAITAYDDTFTSFLDAENDAIDDSVIKELALCVLVDVGLLSKSVVCLNSRVMAYSGCCFYVLIRLADALNSTATECLQLAYDKISKRTGKMENGVFIREGDNAKAL